MCALTGISRSLFAYCAPLVVFSHTCITSPLSPLPLAPPPPPRLRHHRHPPPQNTGSTKYPIVLGHEAVGVVEFVGSEVTNFKVGDHAGVGCIVSRTPSLNPLR
jgi:Alcohol dehydrogenase GroES-like domain